MRFISYFILSVLINALALWVASTYISGFVVTGGLQAFAISALILTAINIFIRPVVKLLFGPIILLTLGLGIILVNALMLYLLDFLTPNITISGLLPLLYATILISVVNVSISFLIHLSKKD